MKHIHLLLLLLVNYTMAWAQLDSIHIDSQVDSLITTQISTKDSSKISHQASVPLIAYSPEFQFKDGVYLNAKDLKNNSPIPQERIVTNLSSKDFDFYENLLSKAQISLYDQLGELITVDVSEVWGYVQNGVIFINLHEEFNRIPIVGSICHFVANKIVVNERFVNPTNYGTRSAYGYNNSYYNNGATTQYTSKEMTQYILDFESGEVREYNAESLSIILMRDPELHDKFEDLSNRNKEKKKFYFIRQFNTRNPLYLPAK